MGFIELEYYNFLVTFIMMLLIIAGIISKTLPVIRLDYVGRGKIEHYNVIGFYRFLKDFTSLSEKEITENILWREYLQFAILFRINNNYNQLGTLNIMTYDETLDFLEKVGKDSNKNNY